MAQEEVFSYLEVEKHHSEGDLWIVVDGNVYDVSKFGEHPGGQRVLLSHGGRNATEVFGNVGHSEHARELMANFKIGRIKSGEEELLMKGRRGIDLLPKVLIAVGWLIVLFIVFKK